MANEIDNKIVIASQDIFEIAVLISMTGKENYANYLGFRHSSEQNISIIVLN